MIFGNIEIESIVQTNDKTRINCVKTFISKDEPAITGCRIKPETSGAFIDIGSVNPKDFFLDWQYATDGVKTVTLEITNIVATLPVVTTFTKDITIITPANDKLFSTDQDLMDLEPDLLKWIPSGRNSFLNVHRASQKLILDWLDSIRIWHEDGTKLTKADLSLSDDLKQTSIYQTLSLIYAGISNKTDDVFLMKSRDYMKKCIEVRERGRIQADLDGSGDLATNEGADMKSFRLVRR